MFARSLVVGQCKHDLVRKTVQVRLWDDEMTARLIAPQKTKRPEIGRTNRIVGRGEESLSELNSQSDRRRRRRLLSARSLARSANANLSARSFVARNFTTWRLSLAKKPRHFSHKRGDRPHRRSRRVAPCESCPSCLLFILALYISF